MPKIKYRKEIDGLRAIAVLPVVFFHAGITGFSGGFVGVDVFFVISGFLITSIILSEKESGTFTLTSFYERRARRLLPALFVVMLICCLGAWLWMMPESLVGFAKGLISVATFSSNFFFWQTSDYFHTTAELNPLLHTWSLAVEEQYYILFPIFLLLTWRLRRRHLIILIVAICLTSLALAQWSATYAKVAGFYLLPTRTFEILIGTVVAFYLHEKPNLSNYRGARSDQWCSLIGFFLISYSIVFFDKNTPLPSLYTLIPTIGTALIILYADENTLIGRLLQSKILVGIGLISYGLYVWHQPLFAFAKQVMFDSLSQTLAVALIGLTFVLAYTTWKYIETPVRDKNRIKAEHFYIACLTFLASFIAVSVYVYVYEGVPSRIPEATKELLSYVAQSRQSYGDGCHLAKGAIEPPTCVKGAATQPVRVALLGDSHAASLVQELNVTLAQRDVSFVQFTKNGCPFAEHVLKQETAECEEYQKLVFNRLAERDIETVVVLSFWTDYLDNNGYDNGEGGVRHAIQSHDTYSIRGVAFSEKPAIRKSAILSAYKDAITKLLRQGIQVVLVYPIPEPGWDVPASLIKAIFLNAMPRHQFAAKHQRYIESSAEVRRVFDGIEDDSNLVRIRPDAIFCDTYVPSRCAIQLHGKPLYTDNNHLSNSGARLLVDEITKQIPLGLQAMKKND